VVDKSVFCPESSCGDDISFAGVPNVNDLPRLVTRAEKWVEPMAEGKGKTYLLEGAEDKWLDLDEKVKELSEQERLTRAYQRRYGMETGLFFSRALRVARWPKMAFGFKRKRASLSSVQLPSRGR